MLMTCTKAYSSSCSQTVSLSQPFHHSLFLKCAIQPKIAKINKKTPFEFMEKLYGSWN